MPISITPKSRMVPRKKTRGTSKGTYFAKMDDNNWYLRSDGSRQLSHRWDAGPHQIAAASFIGDNLAVRSQTQSGKRFEMAYNDAEECMDIMFVDES